MEKKLAPRDFEAEVQRLKAAGQMPSLEQVLAAVAEARKKFAQRILDARRQGQKKQA